MSSPGKNDRRKVRSERGGRPFYALALTVIKLQLSGMSKSSDAIVDRFITAQNRLVLQAADLSLETIASMVEKGSIDISPQYQRRERWDNDKQSALIESFLLNVPVPPIYLAEDDFGTYSVIDGKQRITAIHKFMRNNLTLSKLQSFTEIIGGKYQDLPRPLQSSLEVRPYLRVVTLLRQSDSDLKYEVFTRLNIGGEPLNPQEIRNVAFRGELNDLIYRLAEHRFLKQQLKVKDNRSSAYRNMVDVEFVLRFFALSDKWESFSGDYRDSMDNFMIRHRATSTTERNQFEQRFMRSIDFCERIWGRNAFKRPGENGWRDQMLAGMYDAQMVAVALADGTILERAVNAKDLVQERTRNIFFTDPYFDSAVRVGTNNSNKVRYRIRKILEILQRVG